ncbi:hypothetical protein C8J57DRAFT_1211411 [Mycena rebaudengoi]|nr:hypothetical protein C8J57DRAFT_1211411 [Mycena rebaudengoi]
MSPQLEPSHDMTVRKLQHSTHQRQPAITVQNDPRSENTISYPPPVMYSSPSRATSSTQNEGPTPPLARPSSEFYRITLPGYGETEGNSGWEDSKDIVETASHDTTITQETTPNISDYARQFPTEEQYMDSQSGKVWMNALATFLEARRYQTVLTNYDAAYSHMENVIIQVVKRGVERVFEVYCSPRSLLAVGMTLECHGCLGGGWIIDEIQGQDEQHVYMCCTNHTFREIAEIRMIRRYQYRPMLMNKARHMAQHMVPCFFAEWD